MRLIDGDELIKKIQCIPALTEKLHGLIKIILNMPEVEAVPVAREWIPCSERLPEESGYYLYLADNPYRGLKNGVGVSYYQHKVKEWKKVYTPCVIAWMPLPEPYRTDMSEEV